MEVNTDVSVNIPPTWQPVFFFNGSLLVLSIPTLATRVLTFGERLPRGWGEGKVDNRFWKEIKNVA